MSKTGRFMGPQRAAIITMLLQEKGCIRGGWRKAIFSLCEEAAIRSIADGDEEGDIEAVAAFNFSEATFYEHPSNSPSGPAAYRIDQIDGEIHIHVYEIENSVRIPAWKFCDYGIMADSGSYIGGLWDAITLHVLDKRGIETHLFEQDLLEFFGVMNSDGVYKRADLFEAAAERAGQRQIDLTTYAAQTPNWRTTSEKERAILTAVYEMGIIKPGEL